MRRKTASDAEQLIGLFGAYGFEVRFYRPENHLIRFANEDTFFDLWYGRGGFTLGQYFPMTDKMRYFHNVSHESIEDIITGVVNTH